MGVQWVTLRQQQDSSGMVTVTQHWYLTEDKTRVVAEGDPDGRWLWASPGTEVPMDDAIRLGAVKAEPEPEAEASAEPEETSEKDAEPETKAAKPAANKAAKQVPNKAAAKGGDK